jgi:hypothetical protein
MSGLRLPNFWSGMSYCAKAGWLTASGQAKDFSHACSILAKMRRPKRNPPAIKTPLQNIRLPYADS